MAFKIRRDDMVKVISGKDKGKTGKVLHVEPKKSRLFVEGLNMTTRHQRPRSIRDAQRADQVGGVTHQPGPIHISNVMLLDPKSNDPTRVKITREGGQRKRIAKRSGEEID
jgi:large subunit ribosomal protein L24